MKKSLALLLALALIFAFPVTASAAETTEAKVPVTLTVVNTVAPISCTVPACLPVSLIDGYIVTASNAAITNTGKTGAIRVTKVDVQAGWMTAARLPSPATAELPHSRAQKTSRGTKCGKASQA